jgi:ubiquinone/menaquinone biosynthesis C-methylase UbiE
MASFFSAQQAADTFDRFAATYDKDYAYHRDNIGPFVHKAGIQSNESVLDLGAGTGWVAVEARKYTTGRVMGVDVSPKMVAEARRQAKDLGLQIAYLKGDMITMQGLDAIKPAGGFDVITCFWTFSNVVLDQRLAMLNRWKSFLAPGGRMVFNMHHPNHDLAGYHVENVSGKSLFRWKVLDQQSITECVIACEAMGEQARLKLTGELELTGVEGYEDQHGNLAVVLEAAGQRHPSRAQLETGKPILAQKLVNFFWPRSGEQGQAILRHQVVSMMGVWQ